MIWGSVSGYGRNTLLEVLLVVTKSSALSLSPEKIKATIISIFIHVIWTYFSDSCMMMRLFYASSDLCFEAKFCSKVKWANQPLMACSCVLLSAFALVQVGELWKMGWISIMLTTCCLDVTFFISVSYVCEQLCFASAFDFNSLNQNIHKSLCICACRVLQHL